MYESHWGLRESPFRLAADPRYFYLGPSHEEALARLQFLVEYRRKMGLLLGGTGSGKTLLLEVFARQLRASGCCVVSVNLLTLEPREFLWELATRLQRNPGAEDTPFQLWRTIVDRLTENRYQQLPTVLLLDDADAASPQVLAHVVRLLHYDPSSESPLTVVPAARPEKCGRLGRRILDLAELRIELDPWDPDDICQYLQTALAEAGGEQSVFDSDAAARLYELSGGVPRQVARLAELALAAGAGNKLPRIDVETVDTVYHELCAVR